MKGAVGESRKTWFENQRKEWQKMLHTQESPSQDLKLEEVVMLKLYKRTAEILKKTLSNFSCSEEVGSLGG